MTYSERSKNQAVDNSHRWKIPLAIVGVLLFAWLTSNGVIWGANAVTEVPKLHRGGQNDSVTVVPDSVKFVIDDVVQAFMYVGTLGIATMNHLYVDTLYVGKSTTGAPYRNTVAADSLLATRGDIAITLEDSLNAYLIAAAVSGLIGDTVAVHWAAWVADNNDTVTAYRAAIHDSLIAHFPSYFGDITAVTAGAGMTGGASAGAATLNVIGSNHLTIAADSCYVVSIDSAVIANQGITADDIDTTDNDFVFSKAFKGTSSVADSQLMTKGYGDANWSGGGSIKWWDSAGVYDGWGLVAIADGDDSLRVYAPDIWAFVWTIIDSTTARISIADSADGGATRATTSKEADSTDGGAIRSETAKKILTGEDEVSFDNDTLMVIIDNDTIRMRVYVGDDGETVLDLGGDTTIVEGMLRGDTLLAFQFFKAVVSADSALVTKGYGDANWSGGGSIKWRDTAYVYMDTLDALRNNTEIKNWLDTTTVHVPIADSTVGGAARAESAQGLVGFAVNSTDPANGEVLTYYTTGDTLGWSAAGTGAYSDSSGWSRNLREYAGADSLYFDTDTVKYSGTDLIIGGGPLTAYFTDALISLYAPTTFGDTVWMDGNVLTGLPDPANDSDAVSKGYADATYAGGSLIGDSIAAHWAAFYNLAGWGITIDNDSIKANTTHLDARYLTSETGDISSVTAGAGIDGGGTSGDVTLDIDTSWSVGTYDDSLYVRRISGDSIVVGTVADARIASTIARDSELHTRLHNMTSVSDHAATAWRIFYSGAAGVMTELALGSAGTALVSGGASAVPSWSSALMWNAGDTTTGTYVFVDVFRGNSAVADSVYLWKRYADILYQPLEATLTDIADGTIAENLVNTANPWDVNEGGTGAATLTDGGILLGSGTGAITALGVATNGQIPIGDGTTDPVLATISGTTSQIGVTNGAGTITLAFPYSATLAGNPALTANQSVFGTNGLLFEGATANTSEALVYVTDPTADRTIVFPDASFTVPNPDAVVTLTANWVNTANPWADNEVADAITVTGYMQDEDINTFAELQAWVSDSVLVTEKGVGNDIHDSIYAAVDSRYIATIYSPNGLWVADSILVVIDPRTPSAITVTRIDVTCDADPTTELDFDLMWADAFIGNANRAVIDEMNTTSGVTTITSGFDDATVPANKCIYIRFNAEPDAVMTQVGIRVTYTKD